jgi:hypothetical protein
MHLLSTAHTDFSLGVHCYKGTRRRRGLRPHHRSYRGACDFVLTANSEITNWQAWQKLRGSMIVANELFIAARPYARASGW